MSKKQRVYRISCPICGNWLANLDKLPEKTALFNCGKCKKVNELKDLNIK